MNLYMSFDDGRDDFYESYLILKKYNLKGSFHLTTGFIDGTFKTTVFGINRKPLSIEKIQEMHKNGMDISSHGDKHILNIDDFIISKSKINNWCKSLTNIGFSVPNSLYTEDELKDFESKLKNQLSYIRIGRNKKCYSFLSKCAYLLNLLTKSSFFYLAHNKHNVMFERNKYKITALVITNKTTFKNLIYFINKYRSKECEIVLMFHSITEEAKDKWEWSKNNFENLCSYISQNNINCKTLSEY